MQLTWDKTGERLYETGVDRGVLYLPNNVGDYTDGVAWNGLTAVNEQPSGAEATDLYADNLPYLSLQSVEKFGFTIEAYTYPDEFAPFDGLTEATAGITVGQQPRGQFGFCYRTLIGNDLDGNQHGYKLHLVYNAKAAPSERGYQTVNESPEAITFSWTCTTTPIVVPGYQPMATLTIDSTKVDPADMASLEEALYGTAGSDPTLPAPQFIIAGFAASVITVTPAVPTKTGSVITIPSTTGVDYKINGVIVTGTYTMTGTTVVVASPKIGYKFPAGIDDDWQFAP